MENLIRKIKIYLLTGKCVDPDVKEITKFFENFFNNNTIEYYDDSIYLVKNDANISYFRLPFRKSLKSKQMKLLALHTTVLYNYKVWEDLINNLNYPTSKMRYTGANEIVKFFFNFHMKKKYKLKFNNFSPGHFEYKNEII